MCVCVCLCVCVMQEFILFCVVVYAGVCTLKCVFISVCVCVCVCVLARVCVRVFVHSPPMGQHVRGRARVSVHFSVRVMVRWLGAPSSAPSGRSESLA